MDLNVFFKYVPGYFASITDMILVFGIVTRSRARWPGLDFWQGSFLRGPPNSPANYSGSGEYRLSQVVRL